LDLACHLAVSRLGTHSGPPEIGWLDFPEGGFVRDPADQIVGDTGQIWRTTRRPILRGAWGSYPFPAYDRGPRRWTPVPIWLISPDGSRYAYGGVGQIHLVSVATGEDHVIAVNPGSALGQVSLGQLLPIDYEAAGVYVAASGVADDFGLWLLNPDTGTLRDLAGGRSVWERFGSDGFAWGRDESGPGSGPKHLYRLDLRSGERTVWLETADQIDTLAVDRAGHPIVSVHGTLEVLTGPNHAQMISAAPPQIKDGRAVDEHGVWLAAADGIYLLAPDGTFRRMSIATDLTVAGGCAPVR
jgi:hypothetical protein